MADATGVMARIDDWAAAWRARDVERLCGLWDLGGPLCYLGREHRQPLFAAADLRAFIRDACAGARTIRYEPERVIALILDAQTASAFYFVRWARHETDQAKPVGGIVKTSAVFARRGERWQFVHYAEASYAPYRFFGEFFEATAAAGFAGQPRRAMP